MSSGLGFGKSDLTNQNSRASPLNQQQLQQLRMYKRRSITSSPVRYNFNSKSSPPVTMRIVDTANLLNQQLQQTIEAVAANNSSINSNNNESSSLFSPKENASARHSMFSNLNKRFAFFCFSFFFVFVCFPEFN